MADLSKTSKSTTTPITPHRSASAAKPSLKQTSHSYSTSALGNTSEVKDDVIRVLKRELDTRLTFDIPDFVNAVFGHVPHLEKLAGTVFEAYQTKWLEEIMSCLTTTTRKEERR